jgi:histone deacetylase 1/2
MELRGGGNNNPSANMAAKGGRGNNNTRGRGGGGRGGFGRGFQKGGRGGGGRSSNFLQGVFCQLCGKEGHLVIKCYKRFDTTFTGPPQKSASSATASYGIDTNWYVDSGATDHVTSELEKLTIRDKYGGHDQVHSASGAGMDIDHIGSSVLRTPTSNINLNKILHVPKATKNLLSVHRLACDNNAFLEFHPDHFSIKAQGTRRTLLRGRCEGGLYPLKSSPCKSSPNKQVLGVIAKPSVSLWHHRLGHASTSVVKQVLNRHSLPFVSDESNKTMCDACQRGKSHQLPYPISTSVSSSPLNLIFSDVWGPAPSSVGRKTYYVSFIDDHSKFTWIYFLWHKSEVFHRFHEFQQFMERQFNRKILAVQTDWDGEYQSLNSFFKRVGIAHHVSCPHAHQQNGSAERKHRHIVEVGLSLLAHALMPLKFWDEAFSTAVFLINRLPSKVIQNETPFERLFTNKIDYSFLRSFGCACWPNLRPYNTRKLQFRSTQCVFLGYSDLHKGFKCLEPSTGRVYVSRDVVFDEKVFPFANLHPNAGARLRAELAVLPDSLLNPSASFGDAILLDRCDTNPLSTNATPSHGVVHDETGTSAASTGENSSSNGDSPSSSGRHLMCPPHGDKTGTRSEGDLVPGGSVTVSMTAPESGSGSVPNAAASLFPSAQSHGSAAGSSPSASNATPSHMSTSQPQQDLIVGGAGCPWGPFSYCRDIVRIWCGCSD